MSSLWAHQAKEVAEHTHEPARALFFEPRCGKTRTFVEELRRLPELRRVLVVGPQMALRMSWKTELSVLDVLVVDLTEGTVVERNKQLQALAKYPPANVVVLMNFEVLKSCEAALVKWAPDAIGVDEAHLIKSPSAQRTRVLVKLGAKAKWRRILTGTPTPKNYADAYSQYRFLDPTIFGTSLARFVGEYCYTHPAWKSKIIGYKNLQQLEQKIFSVATRVTRAECFDMPAVFDMERSIELPERAQEAYDQMVQREVLEMDGLPYVDATHKLARLVKLQKLTAGFVSEKGGDAVWVHREKISAVLSEIADPIAAGQKVVVSYYFEHEGEEIERAIRELGSCRVDRLSGKTPQRDRVRITAPFGFDARGKDHDPAVLVVQEQVGGLGISLAAASTMIFTSCSFDGASHSQMRDRIFSPGAHLTYVYLRTPKSVDMYVKKVLSVKDIAQRNLLDLRFGDAAYGADDMAVAA